MRLSDAIAQVVASLPGEYRPALGTVVFAVDDVHPDGRRGSYDGVPLPDRAAGVPCMPSVITLYLQPLLGANLATVRWVLLHELGHHLGLTDRELAASRR